MTIPRCNRCSGLFVLCYIVDLMYCFRVLRCVNCGNIKFV